jgi:UDP-N-acetylglucosamine transferase subunit ALG13
MIRYPQSGSLVWAVLKQMPSFLASIRKERRKIGKIISKYKIDLVISDNRYGLYNKDAFCVFMTHQVMLKLPEAVKFLEKRVYKRHLKMISRFDACWIPDYAHRPHLAGDLAHLYPPPANAAYIGPLSRFHPEDCPTSEKENICDVIAIISGPEPSRSNLERMLFVQMSESEKNCILVRGLPAESEVLSNVPRNISVFNHLPACELMEKIRRSRYVIARAGYSTIMDLVAIKKTAILIPTPGQTEQEYLASFYSDRKLFLCINENEFNIIEALNQLSLYTWNLNPIDNSSAIKEIIRIEKLISSHA